jgi:amino acid adenylation domain-containing protein
MADSITDDYYNYGALTVEISRVAKEYSTKIAVTQDNMTYTYQQLLDAVRVVAAFVRSRGFAGGRKVGVVGKRSFGLSATILGVMASGNVVVPLDEKLPQLRRKQLLEEAGADLCLAFSANVFEGVEGIQVIVLDLETCQPLDAVSTLHTDDLPPVDPDAPAYLFFTSGSTGNPKAIVGRQRGLTHFAHWQSRALDVTPSDNISQLAGVSFDGLLKDLSLAFTTGACLCLPPENPLTDPVALLKWIDSARVSILQTFPTVASTLVQCDYRTSSLSSVRWLVLVGELLLDRLVNGWRNRFPLSNARIMNLYGPTESTIAKSFYIVPDGQLLPGIQPIFGSTLPNTELLLLNAGGLPCSANEIGEIVLRTPFASLGYQNGSDADQARFEHHVDDQGIDIVTYSTGDLGKSDSQNHIYCLGRKDDELKVRNVRVNPAEIIETLGTHPRIDSAAVIPVEASEQGSKLLAFVKADSDSLSEKEVKQYLAERLPAEMIPSRIFILSVFPMLPNGKVNRNALLSHAETIQKESKLCDHTARTEPMDDHITDFLRSVWAEALEISSFGVNDDFFELGGHSLLIFYILNQVNQNFDISIEIYEFFAHPTIRSQRDLIESKRSAGIVSTENDPIISQTISTQAPGGDYANWFDLSQGQYRLWLLSQLEPDKPLYTMSAAYRLNGEFDTTAIRSAMYQLVQRNEILRVRFQTINGRPQQSVSSETLENWTAFETVDYSDLSESLRDNTLNEFLQQASETVFDLETGPLFKVQLLKLAEQQTLLCIQMHHIISDALSWNMLLEEFVARLHDGQEHQAGHGNSTVASFRDFVLQESLDASHASEEGLQYWQRKLGSLSRLELPTDFPRPARLTFFGNTLGFELDEALSEKLRELAKRCQVTLYVLLLAIFKLQLARYTNQTDIVVGSDSSARHKAEFNRTLGFFVNTLVLRTELDPDLPFVSWVQQVKTTVLGAFKYQSVPFQQIVEAVDPDRELNRTPLFQVMFRVWPRLLQTRKLSQGTMEPIVRRHTRYSKFDLTLAIFEDQARLAGEFEYSTDLFSSARIEVMRGHFISLARQIAEAQDLCLSEYQLSSTEDWPERPDLSRANTCQFEHIIDLVRRACDQFPDKLAIESNSRNLTYSSLGERLQQMRSEFHQQGIKAGTVVAIEGPKKPDTYVAIMAAMACEAIVVPLDRSIPIQRRTSMLEVARATVLIRIDDSEAMSIEHIATDSITSFPNTLPMAIPGDRAAYVFFTSGTTSQARGILGTSKSISHFVQWEGQELDVTDKERVAQLTTLTFDAVLRDIFLPLTHGATLCLPPEIAMNDAELLLSWLGQKRVSLVHTIPSRLATWSLAPATELPQLRWIILSGESLTEQDILAFKERHLCNAAFVNFYGPTETTMIKSFYHVPSVPQPGVQSIGKPISCTQMAIWNSQNQVVGVGEIGQIVIQTPCRTLGYINQDADRSSFVVNPFREDPSDIVYRTGDLARYRLDHSIEFLGRVDDQIKISGVRVDPLEVTAVLKTHPEIKTVAVVPWKQENNAQSMVAFVVPWTDQLSIDRVREWLEFRLPVLMVPSLIIQTDHIPLLPNGKVDRQSLLGKAARRRVEYIAPSNEQEEELASMWSDLLGIERVGLLDDFFEIGGHSLLATVLVVQIREAFQVEMPLKVLFETPTLGALSNAIDCLRQNEHTLDDDVHDAEVSIEANSSKKSQLVELTHGHTELPDLFCIHPIGGSVHWYRPLAEHLKGVFNVYALLSQGLNDGLAPLRSIEVMAKAYLQQIHSLTRGPINILGWSFGGLVGVDIFRQLIQQGGNYGKLVLLDSYAPAVMPTPTSVALPENGQAQESNTADLRTMQVFEANLEASKSYVPPDLPIVVHLILAGSQSRPPQASATLGWQEAGINVHTLTVEGDHYSVLQEPLVQSLSEHIRRLLQVDDLQQRHESPLNEPHLKSI